MPTEPAAEPGPEAAAQTAAETAAVAAATLPSALDEIDEPDVAIRLAYQLHPDRKAVLSHGAGLAIMLRPKLTAAAAHLLPWPTELEAIKTWGEDDRFQADLRRMRASAFGFTVALIATTLGAWTLGYPLDTRLQALAFVAIVLALTAAIALVARLVFAAALRRKIARITEPDALEHVTRALTAASARDARRIPFAMRLTRVRFRPVIVPGRSRLDCPFPQRLSGRRRTWTAAIQHWEPGSAVCLYRVHLYEGKRAAGKLLAQVSLEGLDEPWSTEKDLELGNRIAAIAATGRSNAP